MLSRATSSNLSEALMNAKKIEKNFVKREFTFLDRDRNKIRANADRHMETFLQLTRKRHETWYRHDKHFREALRKEKEYHEARKHRNRQKLLLVSNPNYVPQVQTTFQSMITDEIALPSITATTTTINSNPSKPKNKTNPSTKTAAARREPLTKVEQRTYQVLRASQKLLDESAARSRYKLLIDSPLSNIFNHKRPAAAAATAPLPTTTISSSSSFNSATLIVPMTSSIDCEEYDRLVDESLKRETFSDFVDHFVKFRPEFREQFGLIHETAKQQRTIKKLRELNQIHSRTKDERYHKLISSLTDLHSEEIKI